MNRQLDLKPRFACLAAILILVGGTTFSAKAEVLPTNIAIRPSFLPDTYLLEQLVPFNNNHWFAIFFAVNAPGQYTFSAAAIDELYSVHSASLGLEFTPSFVFGDAPLLNNFNNPGSFQLSLVLDQSVLLAYWDDYGYGLLPPNSTFRIPDQYDYYGWFRLTRTAAGLTVSDSATALGGGIIVGTYNQIPEPLTVDLSGLGLVGALIARRRRAVLNRQ